MAVLSISKTWASGSVPFEADLDNIRDKVLELFNRSGIDDNNINDTVITTAKILDGSVTGSKLAANVADDSTLEMDLVNNYLEVKASGITSNEIAASAVTTGKIAATSITDTDFADGSIGVGKLAVPTTTTDGSDAGEGGFSGRLSPTQTTDSDSTTFADIANSDVDLTTLGGSVLITASPDAGPTAVSQLRLSYDTGSLDWKWQCRLLRDGSELARWSGRKDCYSSAEDHYFPLSSVFYIDTGASAGFHTYKLQFRISSAANSAQWRVLEVKLIAVEI